MYKIKIHFIKFNGISPFKKTHEGMLILQHNPKEYIKAFVDKIFHKT